MQQTLTIWDWAEARKCREARRARIEGWKKASETGWLLATAFFPALVVLAALVVGLLAGL